MAFSFRNLLVFIALFHVGIVVAALPPCQTYGSPNESPPAPEAGASPPEPEAPYASPPALAPIPPPDLSPEPSEAPSNDGVFDVTKYGAVADGVTESRLAFLAAWEAACGHPGNSTFYIPEGTFMVGPITFQGTCHNDLSPKVEIKGTLLAPTQLTAFKSLHWIAFKNLKGLTVTGGTETGKIDGQGEAEAWKQPSCEKAARCKKLITPSLVKLKDILIRNISGTYNTKSAVTLLCSSDAPCENIRLVNISLNYLVPHTPRQDPKPVPVLFCSAFLSEIKFNTSDSP
ncbi:hypothetical protein V6N11_069986 [Hibiscus sabdariffa]|uniref:Polygalacturonase n=1 Tax=Hibiscus sabdariffa TaxID=183260 RepID=A0ABR2QDQ8_9ROSI